jgi:hypothetical protein
VANRVVALITTEMTKRANAGPNDVVLDTFTRWVEKSARQEDSPRPSTLTYGNRHAMGQRTKMRTALAIHRGFDGTKNR